MGYVTLSREVEKISNKKDFEKFLKGLIDYLKTYKLEWENKNLEDYLEGVYGFTHDIDGFFKNQGREVDTNNPDWKMIANILLAATHYE